jgi:hypothetical protein
MRLLRSAEMTLRDLVGRGGVLVLLVLVPMVFYVARRSDFAGQAVRFACMGLAWSVSTVALFSVISSRGLEPRLRLAGHSAPGLYLGRLVALVTAGALVGGLYAVIICLDQDLVHGWAVAAALVASAVLSVPLGMVVGSVAPRDLEGMLVLIMIVGLQMIIDPGESVARALPLWSFWVPIQGKSKDGKAVYEEVQHAGAGTGAHVTYPVAMFPADAMETLFVGEELLRKGAEVARSYGRWVEQKRLPAGIVEAEVLQITDGRNVPQPIEDGELF